LTNSKFDDERDGGGNSDETGNSESSDSDSDEDDDISIKPVNVSTKPADASQFKQIPEEERSTHFIAIKITDSKIVESAIRVQQHITNQEEVNNSLTIMF
jgi:hypothetical protein